jgi:flagellar basal-body rod modification protein FlgD
MTTSPVLSGTSSTQHTSASKLQLTTQDFIKMMVTQLQNQDPLQPASNEQLLGQMSQIGQLQSANDLQTALKDMVKQNQIASAANLIGKQVTGVAGQDVVKGQVVSVSVANNAVTLNLDNAKTLDLSNVTEIDGAPNKAVAAAGNT